MRRKQVRDTGMTIKHQGVEIPLWADADYTGLIYVLQPSVLLDDPSVVFADIDVDLTTDAD